LKAIELGIMTAEKLSHVEEEDLSLLITLLETPVRIAILDTGINEKHSAIKAGFDEKSLRHEWCHSWVGKDVHDSHGHGTNATQLLLKFAPRAEIYVAKVFSGGVIGAKEAMNVADVRTILPNSAPVH
jgi:hypothetical protein